MIDAGAIYLAQCNYYFLVDALSWACEIWGSIQVNSPEKDASATLDLVKKREDVAFSVPSCVSLSSKYRRTFSIEWREG